MERLSSWQRVASRERDGRLVLRGAVNQEHSLILYLNKKRSTKGQRDESMRGKIKERVLEIFFFFDYDLTREAKEAL